MKNKIGKDMPIFSVIICLHKICDRFYEDLEKILTLKYPKFEVIVIPNKGAKVSIINPNIRIVIPKKSNISLSEKRDIGWKSAKGRYCAYIDDDAYPRSDWLINAYNIFLEDKKIGAVGGPNITPPEDPYWAKIGGNILESYLTSGQLQARFLPLGRYEVAELQGVNIIIPRHFLKKLGGYRNKLYSGDDSKICSDIRELGYKIISDPNVVVYHHRRIFPREHLKQIYSMGKHRGFFVRAYPETLAPLYFLPFILTVGFTGGLIVFLLIPVTRIPFITIFLLFYGIGYLSSLRAGFLNAAIVSIGIITTHMTYGVAFLVGMLSGSFYKKEQ